MQRYFSGAWAVPPLETGWLVVDGLRLPGRVDLPRLAHSFGCPTICAFAHEYPDRIERAVLVSPSPTTDCCR